MSKQAPITYTTRIGKLPHMINMHYIEVPPAVIKKLGGKIKMRLLCTVNNNITFQGGLVALGNGSAYITINAKRMKELKLKLGSEVDILLKKDESEFGMQVPEELTELLKQDDEGKKRFDMLSPGKQRYIIHYVSTVKSSQLRIERALLLITNLKKLPVGKENFREMLGLPAR
jgi:hypothetical protein